MANLQVMDWLLDGDPAVRWQAMRDPATPGRRRSPPSARGECRGLAAAAARLQLGRFADLARAAARRSTPHDGREICFRCRRDRAREGEMLAAINPKIVAELNTLAASWIAVAGATPTPSAPKPPRSRHRKRKAPAST